MSSDQQASLKQITYHLWRCRSKKAQMSSDQQASLNKSLPTVEMQKQEGSNEQ